MGIEWVPWVISLLVIVLIIYAFDMLYSRFGPRENTFTAREKCWRALLVAMEDWMDAGEFTHKEKVRMVNALNVAKFEVEREHRESLLNLSRVLQSIGKES